MKEEYAAKNRGPDELDLVPAKDENTSKDTYSYMRSKRAVGFRIKEGFEQNIRESEGEQFTLVQRVN